MLAQGVELNDPECMPCDSVMLDRYTPDRYYNNRNLRYAL